MGTRNILNKDGQVVGTITLPDGTSESDWAKVLSSYAESPTIPDVTPRQIRQALVVSGISLTDIDTALNSLPEPVKSMAKIEWEYSVAFQRNRQLVSQVGQMLGWTSQQLDGLWQLAASL